MVLTLIRFSKHTLNDRIALADPGGALRDITLRTKHLVSSFLFKTRFNDNNVWPKCYKCNNNTITLNT